MSIHTEYTSYSVESTIFKGYLAWDETTNEKRPGVLVFPEWWGMNEYIQKRTKQIAELGFVAMGVDMYGEGKTVDNPDEAGSLMNTVISDKKIVKDRVQADYNVLKGHPLSDSRRLGAIGYCFGGALVLNMARLGMDLRAVVSFHGALDSFHTPAALSCSTSCLMIIVYFPPITSLEYTLAKYGSTVLEVPTIRDVDAVGAIAINTEFLLAL
mgnify:CR=1 FL=1